jgi:hypothetical protein
MPDLGTMPDAEGALSIELPNDAVAFIVGFGVEVPTLDGRATSVRTSEVVDDVETPPWEGG